MSSSAPKIWAMRLISMAHIAFFMLCYLWNNQEYPSVASKSRYSYRSYSYRRSYSYSYRRYGYYGSYGHHGGGGGIVGVCCLLSCVGCIVCIVYCVGGAAAVARLCG